MAEVSVDMIVPIPVSPDTLAMRGFNQVNGLLEICEIDDILCCISHNKSVQSLIQDCWGKFTPIIGPTCQECGRASRRETCEDCQVWLEEGYPPLKNQALFKYDAMMHDFFQQYKFRGGSVADHSATLRRLFKKERKHFWQHAVR
ncbi:hypothetical protein H7R52_06915 [Weissella confusa]|uniref:Uncharacterized protein n=1 Tax=Weissella confusa TaxID=1583 RepID=A0A923SSZ1_WEICO|nr:hypothetical protein [Weissella confusa]